MSKLSVVASATAASARSNDTVGRLLEEFCKPGALERKQQDGDRHLVEYVDGEARDLPSEAFTKLTFDIYGRIELLVKSGCACLALYFNKP